MQALYTEDYKILLRKIKEDLNNRETHGVHGLEGSTWAASRVRGTEALGEAPRQGCIVRGALQFVLCGDAACCFPRLYPLAQGWDRAPFGKCALTK